MNNTNNYDDTCKVCGSGSLKCDEKSGKSSSNDIPLRRVFAVFCIIFAIPQAGRLFFSNEIVTKK